MDCKCYLGVNFISPISGKGRRDVTAEIDVVKKVYDFYRCKFDCDLQCIPPQASE